MTVFNEWHAANTSKKLRAVKKSNALAGIYNGAKLAYGYMKANDEKHTPLIDEEVATIVVRIFEMYASGLSAKKIAATLTVEGIPPPKKYAYAKLGFRGRQGEHDNLFRTDRKIFSRAKIADSGDRRNRNKNEGHGNHAAERRRLYT